MDAVLLTTVREGRESSILNEEKEYSHISSPVADDVETVLLDNLSKLGRRPVGVRDPVRNALVPDAVVAYNVKYVNLEGRRSVQTRRTAHELPTLLREIDNLIALLEGEHPTLGFR